MIKVVEIETDDDISLLDNYHALQTIKEDLFKMKIFEFERGMNFRNTKIFVSINFEESIKTVIDDIDCTLKDLYNKMSNEEKLIIEIGE